MFGGSDSSSEADATVDGAAPDASTSPRPPTEWEPASELVASNYDVGDGMVIDMSSDGQVIVVGAPNESSNARGIDGDEVDNSFPNAGAAYVFERMGDTWMQVAYLKASDSMAGRRFGSRVSISANGRTIAVGNSARREPDDRTTYIFDYEDSWTETATLEGGLGILSGDGGRVVIFRRELSGRALELHAHAYGRTGPATWTHESQLEQADPRRFGNVPTHRAIVINHDGTVVASIPDTARECGPLTISALVDGVWAVRDQVTFAVCDEYDLNGRHWTLDLSANGERLLVGAPREDSSSSGRGGDPRDNSSEDSGAIYIFDYEGAAWQQVAYLKATVSSPSSFFGSAVALSADGNRAFAMNNETPATIESFLLDEGIWRAEAIILSEDPLLFEPMATNSDGTQMAVGGFTSADERVGVVVFN